MEESPPNEPPHPSSRVTARRPSQDRLPPWLKTCPSPNKSRCAPPSPSMGRGPGLRRAVAALWYADRKGASAAQAG